MSSFDYKLAFHCAPTLAGIKPASLFSVGSGDWEAMKTGIARSCRNFVGRQVYFRRLTSCPGRVLLLVYRRDLLKACLSLPENCNILAQYGYQPAMKMAESIDRLSGRLEGSAEFPHEIGVFLGYPAEDVQGFIAHSGKNYNLCGCWKVYGNPHDARALFSAYEQARSFFCAQVLSGEKIENIQYGI